MRVNVTTVALAIGGMTKKRDRVDINKSRLLFIIIFFLLF
jgi:hypothetical protein